MYIMQQRVHNIHLVMGKEERQNNLLEMIAMAHIGSQAQLVKLLRKKGFSVTQASISRDLDELGVTKESGSYRRSTGMPPRSTFGVVTFELAGGNLIVAKCGSGLASAFAVRLDDLHLNGIVGTIAGDD